MLNLPPAFGVSRFFDEPQYCLLDTEGNFPAQIALGFHRWI